MQSIAPAPSPPLTPRQGYVVLERPLAFQQWVRRYAAQIPEPYILMSEPDHVFVLPPPLWATPTRCRGAWWRMTRAARGETAPSGHGLPLALASACCPFPGRRLAC